MKSSGAVGKDQNWRHLVGFDIDHDALLSTDEIVSAWCAPGLEFTVLYDAQPCPFCGRAPALQTDTNSGRTNYLVFCADPRHAGADLEEQTSLASAVADWNAWVDRSRGHRRAVIPFPRAQL